MIAEPQGASKENLLSLCAARSSEANFLRHETQKPPKLQFLWHVARQSAVQFAVSLMQP